MRHFTFGLAFSSLLALLLLSSNGFSLQDNNGTKKLLIEKMESLSRVHSMGGKLYVARQMTPSRQGSIDRLEGNKLVTLVPNLAKPGAMASFQNKLYFEDTGVIYRIDEKGKVNVFVAKGNFPDNHNIVNLQMDEAGTMYALAVDQYRQGWRIFRIDRKGVALPIIDNGRVQQVYEPNHMTLDSQTHMLIGDNKNNKLYRVNLQNAKTEVVPVTLGHQSQFLYDLYGRLLVTTKPEGGIQVLEAGASDKPTLLPHSSMILDMVVDTSLSTDAKKRMEAAGDVPLVYFVDTEGSLWQQTVSLPHLDTKPLPIKTELAFPNIEWANWEPEQKGKVVPLRPLVLTHAGDGSNRVFMATQHGVIHVFENDQQVKKSQVFLDLQKKVRYNDNSNEEGFLGLAFHPNYKTNGEFFVFYTRADAKLTNVISRFKVSKDNPNLADPNSEEEILKVTHKFWNHDGGTVCFGPDGYLYIVLGDGGAANDPDDNGQNLNSLLGKVLRIDVSKKDKGLAYSIPKDNPFVGKPNHKPEIWCYGLRNPWRMSFDKKTGQLWYADVGQNLWEEIGILKAGGNYGWNRREGFHPFGMKGMGASDNMVEPFWVYHHDLGKSITGGHVYRGSRVAELEGHYLYADYVTNRLWALKYDEATKQVTANRPIADPGLPVLSYGEDEKGDVYFMTFTPTGKGIYRFVKQ